MSALALLRRALVLSALVLTGASHVGWIATPAQAERARPLQCAASARPGVAWQSESGLIGHAVDICREVARRSAASAKTFEFKLLAAPADFASVADGSVRLAFLTPDEIALHRLEARVKLGPAVAEDGTGLVTRDPAIRTVGDLDRKSICFIIGTEAESRLDTWFATHRRSYIPRAFQEADERDDALAAGQCVALADELSALRGLQTNQTALGPRLTIMSEPLSRFPVIAIVPVGSDPQWSQLVDDVARIMSQNAAADQAAVQPPSSGNIAPVMPRASFEAR